MQANIFEDQKKKTKVNPNSKTGRVLKHLQDNGEITSWDAITLYRATRLSAIVYNLKSYGYNISCKRVADEKGTYGIYYYLPF